MQLLKYELLKLWQKKILMLFWILLIPGMWWSVTKSALWENSYSYQDYVAVKEEYAQFDRQEREQRLCRDMDGLFFVRMSSFYQELGLNEQEIESQLKEIPEAYGSSYESFGEEYSGLYSSLDMLETRSLILQKLSEQAAYQETYRVFLEEMPERACKMQMLQPFGQVRLFAGRSIQKSLQDYQRMTDVEIDPDYDPGVLLLGEDYRYILLLMVLLLAFGIAVFHGDGDYGIEQLQNTTLRGRMNLGLGKWLVYEILAFVTGVSAYSGCVVLAGWRRGFGDLGRSIQSIAFFRDCCLPISVGQYLVLTILLPTLVLLVYAGISACILSWLRSGWLAAGSILLWLAVSYVSYSRIPIDSAYNWIKCINLFAFADVKTLTGTYQNLNLFQFPVLWQNCGIVCGLLFFALAFLAMLFSWQRCLCLKLTIRFLLPVIPCSSTSLLFQNSYRLFLTNRGISVLLMVGLLNAYFVRSQPILLGQEDVYYYSFGQELEGPFSPELLEEVNSLSLDIAKEIESGSEEMDASLREARLTELQYRQKALRRIESECEQLMIPYQNGIPVYYISAVRTEWLLEGEWTRSFWTFLLILLLIFVTASYYSEDYQTFMFGMIRTTQKGRKKYAVSKWLSGLVLGATAYFVTIIPQISNIDSYYHMKFWEAPIQSVTELCLVNGVISFRTFLILQFFAGLCAVFLIMSLLPCLALLMKQNSVTRIVAVLILILDFSAVLFQVPALKLFAISSPFFSAHLIQTTGDSRWILLFWSKGLIEVWLLQKWYCSYPAGGYENE